MRAHLALVDEAFFAFVHKFDRVFDRQHVAIFVFIEVVDHRRQGGALARAVGPVHNTRPRGLSASSAKTLYMVREFPKNIEGFSASDTKGNVLISDKINKSTWEIATKNNSTIKINYRVYAFEMSVRTSFVDAEQAFLNGSSVFMYVDKMLNLPSTIEIVPNKNWKQITTTLDVVNGNKWMLTAPDYDMIADSPIEIGNYELIEFKAAGVNHQVAMIGNGNYDAEKIKNDFANIIENNFVFNFLY